MAKRMLAPTDGLSDNVYLTLRAQVTHRLSQLTLEQERLRDVLTLLSADVDGKTRLSTTPLVPESVPEQLPTPKRRGWSLEAREAQRKRMKAHWRKQKAK